MANLLLEKIVFGLLKKRSHHNESNTENKYQCELRGKVNIVEMNGGKVKIHPSTILNSVQNGYHVGMPFETTLIADAPASVIEIGESCRIHGSYIHAWGNVVIGKGVLIAAGTNIVDSNGHSSLTRYARFRQYFKDSPKSIKINDFVWIGMNSTILKGVEIGQCSIVSAGSVVRDSVPEFSVVEGNPARVVRTLNPEEALSEDFSLEELSKEKGFYRY